MEGLRYANIGFAVGMSIFVVGAILFSGNPAALQAVCLLGFILAFAVYHGLDERAKRRKRQRDQ